jgi:hypothetical protein
LPRATASRILPIIIHGIVRGGVSIPIITPHGIGEPHGHGIITGIHGTIRDITVRGITADITDIITRIITTIITTITTITAVIQIMDAV